MLYFENGVAHYRKVKAPEMKINIMGDVQASYREYVNSTVYEDMKYLEEKIRDMIPNYKYYTLHVTVKDRVDQTFRKTQVMQGYSYYPVYITLMNPQGQPVGADREVLRIPFMDDYCKVNIDGDNKVVMSVLRSAEDVSYNLKINTFNIAMPHANIRVRAFAKGIKILYGKQSFGLDTVIAAMLGELQDNTNITDIYCNTYLINSMKVQPASTNNNWYTYMTSTSDILAKYKSLQYKLGSTRDALNEVLQLDRALGEKLSRVVPGFPQYGIGDTITKEMLKEFKRAKITTLYVEDHSFQSGYKLEAEAPIVVTELPKGFPVGQLLREKFPQFSTVENLPEDLHLNVSNAIVINTKAELTPADMEFLISMGYRRIKVHPGNSQTVMNYSFEKEICSNYTARLRELTDNIPPGRHADEWVYFYNNPTLERTEVTDHITVHDLMAIYSVMGDIQVSGQTSLLNRDNAFLKKVMLIGDLFSETLRKTIDDYFRHFKSSIANSLIKVTDSNPFSNLTNKWISRMNKERFLAPVDSLNLAAEVSQVCHINTLVANGAEVVDEMRHIAMPFYGRICPFETPAGKKLGLVNTKAMGARIKDNLPMAPYRKVIRTATGIRLSNTITWLTAKDELNYKFSDPLLLRYDDKGNILNTPILASIPNPDVSDEPFIATTINAFELEGGYVDAYPEMSISPSAALIPLIGSDDAIRVSYATAQLRQSVYLHKSVKPLLRTPMYEDIFSYSESNQFTAPCDGKVTYISNIQCNIMTLDGHEKIVYMQGADRGGQLDAVINTFVKVGDEVTEGQLIGEQHKYPQAFVVRAPFDGVITDITDDAITINRNTNNRGFINVEDLDLVRIENSRIMGQSAIFLNIQVSVGDHVKKGQILADTAMSRDGIYTPSRNPLIGYVHTGYNYEDGVCATVRGSIDYISMIAHKLDFTVSTKKHKYTRPEPLAGFKYKAPGDIVAKIAMYGSSNDVDAARRSVVKATLKANGIPYERRILKEDHFSKTYRYHLLAFNRLGKGDKMTGRHGNKGVVSKVLQDSRSFQLRNGRTLEFMFNPSGVPSRMNLGQIDDCKLGLACTVLGIEIDSPSYNGATHFEVMRLVRLCHDLANAPGIGDNITKTYNRAVFDSVFKKYPEYPQEMIEVIWGNIALVLDWTGVFDEKGDARVYNPRTGKYLYKPVTIGYPCYMKQMQEADEKLNVRSGPLDEQYAKTNSQPQKSATSAKGQRMAEMELMALAAAGCSALIDETLNEMSDNEGRRCNNHLKQMGYDIMVPEEYCTSRAVENLLYLFEAVGAKLDVPEYIAKTDFQTARGAYSYNIPRLVSKRYQDNQTADQTMAALSMLSAFDGMPD